jgi:transposase
VLLRAQRAVRAAPRQATWFQRWAVGVATRRGHNKAAIAVANKLARIIWAVWSRELDFDPEVGATIAA